MPVITLYSRPRCHLCDVAGEVISRTRERFPFDLFKVDISGEADLERAYGRDIPVVTVNGRVAFKHRVDEAELTALLLSQPSEAS